MDWRVALREMLIKAGSNGVKQSALTFRLRSLATADDMMVQLEEWRKQNMVQRFRVYPRLGRPSTVWRATVLILEDDSA